MNKLETIKNYALENAVPIIQDEGFQFLKEKFLDYHCNSFLEIGTAIAHTAIQIALLDESIGTAIAHTAIQIALLDESVRVVTIERDPKMIEQARKNIQDLGLENQITLIEGDALEVEVEGVYDCIFIDAAKAQYTRFFNKFSPLLAQDGIILTDNMNFHGLVEHPERTNNRNTKSLVRKIRAYHDFLTELEDFQVEFYNVGDGIALARRKKNA